ncbi:hypothetical protein ACFL3V_02900 [Nanoarchaeota archaeon]
MGLFDKFKKKGDDDLGDLSDLGDFGLDDKSAGGGLDSGGMGDLGGDLGAMPGMDAHPTEVPHPGEPAREEIMPTQTSRDMGDQLGLTPADPAQAVHPAQPQMPGTAAPPSPVQHAMPQPSMHGGPDLGDLMKDMEIVHAKLDAIKSSLDSVNQRLATIERIANPETKNRYGW